MHEVIIALASGLIGSLLGGLIAIYGGVVSVRRIEYHRLRPLLRKTLRNTISKVGQHNNPWILVEDDASDELIADIIQVMPFYKRRGFKNQWKYYRYDKKTEELTPREYQESTAAGRKLIIERLHNLISNI